MSEIDFAHLIEVDEKARVIRIHRVFTDGRRHLFTETPLPAQNSDQDGSAFSEFAQLLGENILLDSPAAKRAMAI